MALNLPLSSKFSNQKSWLMPVVVIIFIVVIIVSISVAFVSSRRGAQNRLDQQRASFESPDEAVKRQVKRILLERKTEEGETEYVEILANGQINRYDGNYQLTKTGLLGFYTVSRLFNKVNQNLDGFVSSYLGNGLYTVTIETNQGTTVIEVTGGGGGGGEEECDEGIGEIICDIEDIEDETLDPTPTPVPTATPIPTAGPSPTPSPTPYVATSPTPTPTVGPGTPTPLPEYMLRDPFTCEEVYSNGKPLPVTNILCGFQPQNP